MLTVTCTQGLPGSGKTTWAKEFLGFGTVVRVNRDDLRRNNFGLDGVLSHDEENLITQMQRDLAGRALRAGKCVIVDDTHLRPKYLRDWNLFAVQHGALFEVVQFPVDVEECIARDSHRERRVGEAVIRGMAAKYMPNGQFLPYTPFTELPSVVREEPGWERVTFDPSLPSTILVDIDGTMTQGPHERKPFEWHKVGQDLPRRAVVNLVNRLLRDGYMVTFMSGRDEVCRYETEVWLEKHLYNVHRGQWVLHMRAVGDNRKDDIVKYELFNRYIRGYQNVKFVLDDRDQVVRMWRAMGLTCLQVDYGDF